MRRIALVMLFPLRYYAFLTSPQAGLPANVSLVQLDGGVSLGRSEPGIAA